MFRRILAGCLALIFLPTGVIIFKSAFSIHEAPHVFVMLIFSGSLTLLLGLCGALGLAIRSHKPIEKEQTDEKPPAASGGHS
jgi:putative effector of murein hydrolase LrgA (UPF0299 family)